MYRIEITASLSGRVPTPSHPLAAGPRSYFKQF